MYQIDSQSRTPVYEQILHQVELYILRGLLKTGEQISSVRALSIELNLNPNTVQRAYTELDRKGLIYTMSGIGSYISEEARELLQAEKRRELSLIEPTIREFVIAGISKEEVIDVVTKVYKEANT